MTEPSASILIRTKNEARTLGACLEAVFSQEGASFEVIVLDSGSTDGTVEIARRFPVSLRTMPPGDFSYGYALNAGFETASHPYLVTLSGHSVPLHRRWLVNLIRHFEDPSVAGVSGPEVNRRAPVPPRRAVRLTPDSFFSDPRFGFSNFNAAVRREAWETLPFHEGLAYGEDKEWAWRMVAEGAGIVIDGEAAVYHEHQETLAQQWRRARREALGQAAWRGARRFSKITALRLALREALANLRAGSFDLTNIAGPFAYYHGRHTGFAEAGRAPVASLPRLLPRRRHLEHPA